MKPTPLLRAASAVAMLQFIAHTVLLVSYVPTRGPVEVAVVDAMKLHRFDFGGFSPHSYWDLYFGYGLFAAFNCLIESVLFWQLAGMARTEPRRTMPVVALFALANLGYAILVWKYFFVIPLIADLAIAACLAASLLAARSLPARGHAEVAAIAR